MPVIIGENRKAAPYYKRMIRCPGHYLISPKVDIYLREPIEAFKNCSDQVEVKGQIIKIRKMRPVRDRWGNKKIDWKKLHQLRKTGEVIHPEVSAAWAIENIWDPEGALCMMCNKPCREGQGTIVETSIRRLQGLPAIR
jgi:hypothetical protein